MWLNRYLNGRGIDGHGISIIRNLVSRAPTSRREHHANQFVGAWNYENMTSGLEAISLGLFTRVLGWSREEVDVFLIDVRKDIKNTKIHCYYPM